MHYCLEIFCKVGLWFSNMGLISERFDAFFGKMFNVMKAERAGFTGGEEPVRSVFLSNKFLPWLVILTQCSC